MSAPNLAAITPSAGTIEGAVVRGQATGSAVSILANANGSGDLLLLESIYLANRSTTNSGTCTLYVEDGSGNITYLLREVTFSIKAVLEALDRKMVLKENEEIKILASAINIIDYSISYYFITN